ncbi:MAG TPA: hypothetical protein PKH23_00035 [Bacillota bacterium]|nr:hypothetical protein [Bacillota bacterium]
MKIIVKSKGHRKIRMWFPTRLLFSKPVFRLYRKTFHSVSKNRAVSSGRLVCAGDCPADEVGEEFVSGAFSGTDQSAERVTGMGFMNMIHEEHWLEAMKILRHMRRDYPGVPLVEVESAQGDYVLIKI